MACPFQRLGVPTSATEEDVNKASRNLQRKYHPDKNRSPNAVTISKDINDAKDRAIAICRQREKEAKILLEATNHFQYMELNFLSHLSGELDPHGPELYKLIKALAAKHAKYTDKTVFERILAAYFVHVRLLLSANDFMTSKIKKLQAEMEKLKITMAGQDEQLGVLREQPWYTRIEEETEARKKAEDRVLQLEKEMQEAKDKADKELQEAKNQAEKYKARAEALEANPTRKHARFFSADEDTQFRETVKRFALNHLSASEDQGKFIPTAKIQDHFKAMHPDIKFNSAIFCKELKAIIEANHSSAKPAKTKVKGYHGVSMS